MRDPNFIPLISRNIDASNTEHGEAVAEAIPQPGAVTKRAARMVVRDGDTVAEVRVTRPALEAIAGQAGWFSFRIIQECGDEIDHQCRMLMAGRDRPVGGWTLDVGNVSIAH